MARAVKKTKELTLEEKLKQALVPVDEQPYDVPENWCWIKGFALFEPMETKKPKGEIFRYIDIDSIDNKRQVVTEPKSLLVKDAPSRASRGLAEGDTVFSLVRPYLKNIAYIDSTISDAIASTGFFVCRTPETIASKYIYNLMISPYVVDGLNQYMKGDNSPSIRKDDIDKFAYPIPPFAEQQRIVDRIESIFAKLDEAKEKAQDVVDGFELRKSAILHKAFTGELTAKWREENGVSFDSWEHKTIGDIIKVSSGKALTSKNMNPEGKIPVYGGNGITGYHDESNVESETVVIGRVGFYCGSVHYISEPAWVTDNALIVYNKTEININYLVYLLKYSDLRQNDSSTAQPVVSGSKIYPISVHTCLYDEQFEIVQILDNLLAKEQQAKEAAEAVLEQIDTMKKAVLARAFRGELGTNDPAEESAVELLKTIL